MKADDVTATLDLALAASGLDRATVVHRPRLLTDNGASYIATAARGKPYWRTIESGLHIGYRRVKEGGGSWVARCHPLPPPNVRSIGNFPMQGNGSDMLRAACILGTDAGIKIIATVHDAVMIESTPEHCDVDKATMIEAMQEAARMVLGNDFTLGVDEMAALGNAGLWIAGNAVLAHRGLRLRDPLRSRVAVIVEPAFLDDIENELV